MTVNAIQSTSALSQIDSPRRPTQPPMTNTAQLLGLSTSDLSTAVRSGKTLGSLASAAGVSSSDLLGSVEADIPANAPQGAQPLSSDQLKQMATDLINRTGFGGGSLLSSSNSAGYGSVASSGVAVDQYA